jgi:hypothetical protein
VPSEAIEGNTPDISECAQFDWYEYVWYLDPAVPFLEDAKKLGCWVGVAHDVGSPMTYWILPASCKVVARSTVSSFTEDELNDPVVQAWIAKLDLSIKERIGDTLSDEEIDGDLVEFFP